MTQEEFKERLTVLVDKKNAIKQEIKKLQDEYLANYPIQPGDMCVEKKVSFVGLTDCFFGTRQPHPRQFSLIPKRKMVHAPSVVNRFLPIVLLK